jgi:glycosyltransferase involved in cell wall biosynthesis
MQQYIVVHSGARDDYKLVEYLHKNNRLAYFITDDILFRKKYRYLLPYTKIIISKRGLFYHLLNRFFPKNKNFNKKKDYWLSRKCGKISSKYNKPILSYSYYATEAFSISKMYPKILFQLHPHPLSVRKIFDNEINKNPKALNSLSQENEYKYSKEDLIWMAKESQLADFYIVTSYFAKKTLMENGIASDKIRIVPYGVDLSQFNPKSQFRKINSDLRILFIGSFNQRKGLTYMLDAVQNLQQKAYNISLSMTGRGIMDMETVQQYDLKNFNCYYNLPLDKMIALMHESDVFLFPSLCEGFGLVILQAMATGLPVISTQNTIAADIVENYKTGIIIPTQNVSEIENAILYFINNPDKVEKMGKSAIQIASDLTWDKFGNNLIAAIEYFENRK